MWNKIMTNEICIKEIMGNVDAAVTLKFIFSQLNISFKIQVAMQISSYEWKVCNSKKLITFPSSTFFVAHLTGICKGKKGKWYVEAA